MKTAITELIEYFQQQKKLQDDPKFIGSGREAYDDAIEVCNNALEKEKEQIVNAYSEGNRNGLNNKALGANKYYRETYKTYKP